MEQEREVSIVWYPPSRSLAIRIPGDYIDPVKFRAILLATVLSGSGPAFSQPEEGGFFIEKESQVGIEQPGPHKGTGTSVGYVFFKDIPNLSFSFRKRVLHPGASIGYHLQHADEVYYILSGNGAMTIDGNEFEARPGDAFLTRAGSSHGLSQTGRENLCIIVMIDAGKGNTGQKD